MATYPPVGPQGRVAKEPAAIPAILGTAAGRIEAVNLFAGHRELLIDHAGSQYRLRITRNNKLILTK